MSFPEMFEQSGSSNQTGALVLVLGLHNSAKNIDLLPHIVATVNNRMALALLPQELLPLPLVLLSLPPVSSLLAPLPDYPEFHYY